MFPLKIPFNHLILFLIQANPTPAPLQTSFNHLGRFCGRRLNCYTNSASNSVLYSSYVPFVVQAGGIFSNTPKIANFVQKEPF